MPYGSESDHKRFVQKCLIALDHQVFKLESEEAKIAAIQAVQRILKMSIAEHGTGFVLKLIKYPEGRKDFWDI